MSAKVDKESRLNLLKLIEIQFHTSIPYERVKKFQHEHESCWILELLQADYDFQKILDAYPSLNMEDIKAALEYAAKMAKNEDIVFYEASHGEVSH